MDLCLSPERAAEVTLQPVRRFGLDAEILFSDILMIPYGLGQRLWFEAGEGPRLEPLGDPQALDPAALPARVAPIYETVRRVKAALAPAATLIGFAGGLFTVAAYMTEGGGSREFANVRLRAYQDAGWMQSLINVLLDATATYLVGQIDAGAEVVQIFDSWAGLLPEDEFRRWVIAPTQALVARLHAERPHVPVIGFPRGAGALYETYARETGINALGLDTTVPLGAARALQKILPVQGNLDPLLLVAGGTAMTSATHHLLKALANGPFIFNLGHGVVPQTPPEHVADLVNFIRSHKAERAA